MGTTGPDEPAGAAAAPAARPLLPWALFALALATAALFAYLWWSSEGVERRRAEVTRQSRAFALSLTNFSAATIEADVERIRSYAVGDFADEVEVFFGPDAVAAIREADAESRGEVVSLFVQEIEGDTAGVFAVIRQTVTNRSAPEPRVEVVRFDIGLIETTEGWKVNRVEVLQTRDPSSVLPGSGGG
ncbi:MAG: hypothetical protein HY658_03965 [Actinobacteria bacterium]|nr:hypothetical protein [Actinomycetota bacterium]